ncbi:hypothetical protein [Myxococcus sp. SDU36]|uniref:hypothetical protein n=1 Tax=Myxococcus sp. SDU36 TaxID=2831967 RepID=UPI002542766B|nr:hypothetical protein [Myxococcus sp. SDU36]WIG98709.1 carboxypeptidase-like regulatory domain-containing protein [Myxococcus sp. SDU36]
MREQDGALHVEVLGGAGPVRVARVTVYLLGASDRRRGRAAWFTSGQGSTDASGELTTLPARAGDYLVSAKAEGLAPARVSVTRARGEARTQVGLTLEAGAVLAGRTAARASREPVTLTQRTRTPRTRGGGAARTPDEEQHTGASDSWGAFRFEGLAPGEYLLEARPPGTRPRASSESWFLLGRS